jgi:superfamily II DNA/RNA helicase
MTTTTTPVYVQDLLKQLHLTPRGVQQEAIDRGLLEGSSIMVSSPTGSGKTLVGEMALLRAIYEGKQGLYLVPLRALAVQIANGLRERYEKKNISIGESHGDFQLPGTELSDHELIVTTYERADSLLRHNTDWLSNVGTVVIDEIQNLSEERRGPRLESVIIRLKRKIPDLQIVALSATIADPMRLADWLGCKLVESYERPVPLRYSVVYKQSREEAIKELVMTTVQKNGQVIVFHRTRREAEADSIRLSDDVSRHLTSEERTSLSSQMDSIEHWDVSIPTELTSVIHNGVAYHHAGLAGRTRRLIEHLFEKGLLRVICATTTLASGINLPARTVILATTRSPSDYRNMISANKVHQMLGRAGRPGRDTKGFGIILAESRGEVVEIKKRYFKEFTNRKTGRIELEPVFDTIESKMNSNNDLTEQLLVALDYFGEATLEQIEFDFLADSFLMYCAIDSDKKPMRLFELGEITARSAIERHAYASTVRSIRQNRKRNVKIREISNTVIGGIVSNIGSNTCRFSIKQTKSGMIEGPLCSCENPIGVNGILCPHLVELGFEALEKHKQHADYIIPLSLSESSPYGTLLKLGLIEGATEGKLKPTKLGMSVCRLYLGIMTVKEMIPVIPVLNDTMNLLKVIQHLITIESGQIPPENFEHILGMAMTTNIPLNELSQNMNLHHGDIYGLLERTRWIAYSLSYVAKIGNMIELHTMVENLLDNLENRLQKEPGDQYDN